MIAGLYHYLGVMKKWVLPNIGIPQNGWFIMENLIKMDDLGVPQFSETPKWPQGIPHRENTNLKVDFIDSDLPPRFEATVGVVLPYIRE